MSVCTEKANSDIEFHIKGVDGSRVQYQTEAQEREVTIGILLSNKFYPQVEFLLLLSIIKFINFRFFGINLTTERGKKLLASLRCCIF